METKPHDNPEDDAERDDDDESDSSVSSSVKARVIAKAAVKSSAEKSEFEEEKEEPKTASLFEAIADIEPLPDDADPEELSEDELHFAEAQIIHAHEEAESHTPPPEEGSVEARAAEARAAFRQKLLEDIDSEQALAETLAEHDIIDIEAGESEETGLAEEAAELVELGEEPVIILGHEDEPDDSEDLATTATHTAGAGSGAAATPPVGGASGAGGGGSHRPPIVAGGGGGSGGAGGSHFGGHGGPAGPAFGPPVPIATPTPVAARPPRTERVDDYAYPTHPAQAALLGGIIGYFIGRRRGRIRTEKKLLPIQKKLEKRVQALEFDISQKEAQITKAVHEKEENQRFAKKQPETSSSTVVNPKAEARPNAKKAEQLKERRTPAPEAHQLHGKKSAPESIGKVLIQAESLPILEAAVEAAAAASRPEHSRIPDKKIEKEVKKPVPSKVIEKHTETMNHQQLIELSKKIEVNGSTLNQIYESRLVSEKGLRRLVLEHLSGGDVKKALRQEITEREIDFERDPLMRDQSTQAVSGGGGNAQARLQKLLEKAEAIPMDNHEEAAFLKAQVAHDEQEQAKKESRRRLLDVAMVTSIVVLAVLTALLLMEK